ncbi:MULTISPECIES: protein kinase domain-containing protein [Rhizobium]|uniref:Protein kinase domain-containing protein n=1 Tax=Rhizobium anhuiense TaxID=1184720 RepID=A0A432NC78_9HYPH|nr:MULTISPECIES: protein kinase [Rhizobium]MBA1344147.1 protein kinase [Rhizobium sp. WYCCWR 11146]RUL97093.1 hypothetical protein EEQ99_28865 [Rhizobium anhuiense]TBZ91480.1 hypothetical protein E0H63_37025 [Rhizobium leguminosarum bv. viciae]GGE05145.1 hypothetical protein GCM10008012_55250 [Rhizobium anhuiense]
MDSAQAKIFAEGFIGNSVGGWAIDGILGNGKSAVVLSGVRDGVEGAVKIFHPELIERYGRAVQLERINRERQLIGKRHPHLVRILEGGECAATGHLFVVMERLPFKNFHQVGSSIPPENYGTLVSQIASAARFLEDLGLAHRDVKPENIAISDDFSRAILLDLGVLLPIGVSNLTDADQRPFIGTLRYSSPEFLDRKEKDTIEGWRAVTFYQMGAVLHDLLMKKPIFADVSEPFTLLVDAVRGTTPNISGGEPRLMFLARRALVKNPEVRLEMLSWSDFEDAAKPENVDAEARKLSILERQKLARANMSTASLADAERRRLFLQRMDQFAQQLDTRLASILAEAAYFPLRRSDIFEAENDSREIMLSFSADEAKGMEFPLALKFVISNLDDNEGTPQYVIRYSDALSSRAIEASELNHQRTIFKGSEEDLYSSSLLQAVLLETLESYYTKIETGSVAGDAIHFLSAEENGI